MSKLKFYNVIGIMSGTSMDGLDCSYIKTDGKDFVKIISEKSYNYSINYRKKLNTIIRKYYKNILTKCDEDIVTKKFITLINKFLKEKKINKSLIDFIGLSGQTIFHDPKNKKSIQLGSCRKIQKKLNIKIIGQFRKNDIMNGGQGSPIGSFYHKYLIKKLFNSSAILNIGGISNITFFKKKLISFDVGPGNCLIDDLMKKLYKQNFDKNGKKALQGKNNLEIINLFKKDKFFKKKYPKSLDRNDFNKYFLKLINIKKDNAIRTATSMTVLSIIYGIKLPRIKIKYLVLTGGGRKNKYIFDELEKILKKNNIKVKLIDQFNFNGDMLESQAFGYIATRSFLNLPISIPSTTGVKKPMTGGKIYE